MTKGPPGSTNTCDLVSLAFKSRFRSKMRSKGVSDVNSTIFSLVAVASWVARDLMFSTRKYWETKRGEKEEE